MPSPPPAAHNGTASPLPSEDDHRLSPQIESQFLPSENNRPMDVHVDDNTPIVPDHDAHFQTGADSEMYEAEFIAQENVVSKNAQQQGEDEFPEEVVEVLQHNLDYGERPTSADNEEPIYQEEVRDTAYEPPFVSVDAQSPEGQKAAITETVVDLAHEPNVPLEHFTPLTETTIKVDLHESAEMNVEAPNEPIDFSEPAAFINDNNEMVEGLPTGYDGENGEMVNQHMDSKLEYEYVKDENTGDKEVASRKNDYDSDYDMHTETTREVHINEDQVITTTTESYTDEHGHEFKEETTTVEPIQLEVEDNGFASRAVDDANEAEYGKQQLENEFEEGNTETTKEVHIRGDNITTTTTETYTDDHGHEIMKENTTAEENFTHEKHDDHDLGNDSEIEQHIHIDESQVTTTTTETYTDEYGNEITKTRETVEPLEDNPIVEAVGFEADPYDNKESSMDIHVSEDQVLITKTEQYEDDDNNEIIQTVTTKTEYSDYDDDAATVEKDQPDNTQSTVHIRVTDDETVTTRTETTIDDEGIEVTHSDTVIEKHEPVDGDVQNSSNVEETATHEVDTDVESKQIQNESENQENIETDFDNKENLNESHPPTYHEDYEITPMQDQSMTETVPQIVADNDGSNDYQYNDEPLVTETNATKQVQGIDGADAHQPTDLDTQPIEDHHGEEQLTFSRTEVITDSEGNVVTIHTEKQVDDQQPREYQMETKETEVMHDSDGNVIRIHTEKYGDMETVTDNNYVPDLDERVSALNDQSLNETTENSNVQETSPPPPEDSRIESEAHQEDITTEPKNEDESEGWKSTLSNIAHKAEEFISDVKDKVEDVITGDSDAENETESNIKSSNGEPQLEAAAPEFVYDQNEKVNDEIKESEIQDAVDESKGMEQDFKAAFNKVVDQIEPIPSEINATFGSDPILHQESDQHDYESLTRGSLTTGDTSEELLIKNTIDRALNAEVEVSPRSIESEDITRDEEHIHSEPQSFYDDQTTASVEQSDVHSSLDNNNDTSGQNVSNEYTTESLTHTDETAVIMNETLTNEVKTGDENGNENTTNEEDELSLHMGTALHANTDISPRSDGGSDMRSESEDISPRSGGEGGWRSKLTSFVDKMEDFASDVKSKVIGSSDEDEKSHHASNDILITGRNCFF